MTAAISSRRAEVDEKLARVRGLLDERGLGGALFTRQATVAWLTAGVEDIIIRGSDPGFVWALVTPGEAYLVMQNIEGPRVSAEESPAELGFEVVEIPWQDEPYDARVSELCDPARLVNDGFGPGTPLGGELQRLRLSLTQGERERYDVLGRDACAALEASVRAVRRGESEREVAARIVAALERVAIFPSVLLVGADDRHLRFRHPAVSDAPVERDVLSVIVGIRGGLNIACTRTVSLDAPDATLLERHSAACEAEAHMIAATRPGATYGEALQAGLDVYERLGYPGEWRNHYQGGQIGYGAREFGPTPASHANAFTAYPVAVHQACAWNPTVQGAKSEDTFVVEAGGNRMITNSADWPALTFEVAGATLQRPAILQLA